MKVAILDAHGKIILAWDLDEIVERTFPRPRLHARKRRLLRRELGRVVEQLKLELFAL